MTHKLDAFLTTNGPRILSISRIIIAFLFIQHGMQKIFAYPLRQPGEAVALASLMGLAGILETFGGFAILLGIFTRPIAFILSGEMAAAYFMGHASRGFWPIHNGGDLAVFYSFFFLYLAAAGAGPWSLDAAWRGVKKPSGLLSAWEPQLRSVLRIVVAFLFIPHGTEDMIGWPWPAGEEPFEGADFSRINGYGHLIEMILGPLVLVGLFTRPLSFLLSGEMAFAYFWSHQPRTFWPILNGGEDTMFFSFIFLFFAAVGAGPWGLDRFLNRKSGIPDRELALKT
jgi:putative oxidoreductase